MTTIEQIKDALQTHARTPSPETDPEQFPSGPLEYEGGSAIEQAIARGDTATAEQWFKEQSEKATTSNT